MKRISIIISAFVFLSIFSGYKASAQSDDVYYSPANDKGTPAVSDQSSQQNYSGQQNADGYSTDYKLQSSKTYVDSNGNTIINNNYYSDNNYTSQLERFYGPRCGFGYYDYAYTPAYYWGWGGYGFGGLGYGYGYYGDYWGFNLGWGICGYYSPWYSPFGYYGYYGCGYGLYGYGYGRGYGYGYGHHHYGYGYGYGLANNGYYFGPRREGIVAHQMGVGTHAGLVSNSGVYAHNTTAMSINGANQVGVRPQSNPNPGRVGQSAHAENVNGGNNGWKAVTPHGWHNNSGTAANTEGGSSPRAQRQAARAQQSAQRGASPSPQFGNSYHSGNYGGAPRSASPSYNAPRSASPSPSYSAPRSSGSAPVHSYSNSGAYHGNSSSGSGGGFHGGGGGSGVSHSSGGGGRH